MSNRWEIPESDGSIPKYIVDLMQHVYNKGVADFKELELRIVKLC